MHPWNYKYLIKPCGNVCHVDRQDINLAQLCYNQHPRPRFGRDGINYDTYTNWYEKYFHELNEGEYVLAKDDDYSYPWKNPILITSETEYFIWLGEKYKRLPIKYGIVPRYFIHENSTLIALNDRRPKIVKSHPMGRGIYLQHTLTTPDRPRWQVVVQRLMAEAYLGDVEGLQVDHIDCNTHNNNLSNLQIVTQDQNLWLRDARSDRFSLGIMCKNLNISTELPTNDLTIDWS